MKHWATLTLEVGNGKWEVDDAGRLRDAVGEDPGSPAPSTHLNRPMAAELARSTSSPEFTGVRPHLNRPMATELARSTSSPEFTGVHQSSPEVVGPTSPLAVHVADGCLPGSSCRQIQGAWLQPCYSGGPYVTAGGSSCRQIKGAWLQRGDRRGEDRPRRGGADLQYRNRGRSPGRADLLVHPRTQRRRLRVHHRREEPAQMERGGSCETGKVLARGAARRARAVNTTRERDNSGQSENVNGRL
eukprot:gene17765-biopygen8537